jgi:hypothetical protein
MAMKAKTLLLALAIVAFAMSLSAAPRLINYQGMLTDKQGKPITTPVEVTFTFWDAETSGTQLGAGFSDKDTVTPDADGIYSTLIGDDPGNLIPESVFSGDSVWLNVNIAGDNLANRMRITSAGFAINAMNAGHATTADSATNATNAVNAGHATTADSATNATNAATAITAGTAGHSDTSTTATRALGLAGVLNNPGDQINLGTNALFEVNAAGQVELVVNGKHYRLVTQGWINPFTVYDNISPDGQTAQNPQVAMDNNGNAIITWEQSDGSNIQIFKSEYRGGVWTHPSSLLDNISPNGQNAYAPQVAMDNSGNAIIVWRQSDGSKYQIFKSEYRGGVWTHPSFSDHISPDGQNAYNPQVAMDNNGNAIITWYQSDGSNFQIFKSEYRGGVWTYPSFSDHISPDGQHAYNPQVAMDNNGNAIITWYQSDGSKDQIFKSEYRGGGWTHPSSITDHISPDGQNADYPQVAMDNNGNAIITWEQIDGTNYQIFKSEYRGGVWTHPLSLSDNISPDGQTASNPQIAMDNNGNAIIIWYQSDGSKKQIFMSEFRGDVWTHPSSLTDNISPDGQNAYNTQVALDNNGNAIITWYQSDGSNLQIFESEYRGNVWNHPSSLSDNISPDGQNADSPQVAMDNNGNAIITWHQYVGSYLQIFKSEFRWGF